MPGSLSCSAPLLPPACSRLRRRPSERLALAPAGVRRRRAGERVRWVPSSAGFEAAHSHTQLQARRPAVCLVSAAHSTAHQPWPVAHTCCRGFTDGAAPCSASRTPTDAWKCCKPGGGRRRQARQHGAAHTGCCRNNPGHGCLQATPTMPLTRTSCRRPAAAAACCCRPPQLPAAAAAAAPPRRLSCVGAAGAAADVLAALARLNAARHRACRLRPAAAMLLFAANPNSGGARLLLERWYDPRSGDCRAEGPCERRCGMRRSAVELGQRGRPVGAVRKCCDAAMSFPPACGPPGTAPPCRAEVAGAQTRKGSPARLQALLDHWQWTTCSSREYSSPGTAPLLERGPDYGGCRRSCQRAACCGSP